MHAVETGNPTPKLVAGIFRAIIKKEAGFEIPSNGLIEDACSRQQERKRMSRPQ